ncbi:MAG: hypothetical protein ACRDMX_04225 [Solirubrobacteraceae bacterium]
MSRFSLALASIAAAVALAMTPATALGCAVSPSSGYYTTTAAGNVPSVYQTGSGCYDFVEGRGYLNPSYINWRGWLYTLSGYYTNGWHYDSTGATTLETNVANDTYEHAQGNSGSGWRMVEEH